MNNKILLASLALAAGAAMTSCVADTEPRIEKPTEFVLNVPAFAEQLYVFDADDKGNSLNDITFTVTQPDYGGVATTPDYKVQVARSAEDFQKWDELQNLPPVPDTPDSPETPDGPAAQADDAGELPLAEMVDFTTSSASITIDGEVFCMAVNKIYGLTLQNAKDEAHPVAVRVLAAIPNAPYADIWSNPVTINVRSYVKPVPDKLWVIGECQGWNIAGSDDYVLDETEIGNKIYQGEIKVEKGKFMLRFYDELGDWDSFSVGSQLADNPLPVMGADGTPVTGLTEEGITVPCIQSAPGAAAKGSWEIKDWPGGKVAITVDLNTNQVTFALGQAKKLWIIGACQGWDINGNADYVLRETEEGSNIFAGTVNIDAGAFEFRFYSATGDWETNSLGSQEADDSVDISVTTAGTTQKMVNGKGKWKDASWAGGECAISVDLKAMQVTFTKL